MQDDVVQLKGLLQSRLNDYNNLATTGKQLLEKYVKFLGDIGIRCDRIDPENYGCNLFGATVFISLEVDANTRSGFLVSKRVVKFEKGKTPEFVKIVENPFDKDGYVNDVSINRDLTHIQTVLEYIAASKDRFPLVTKSDPIGFNR
jgi:hypothetical protein